VIHVSFESFFYDIQESLVSSGWVTQLLLPLFQNILRYTEQLSLSNLYEVIKSSLQDLYHKTHYSMMSNIYVYDAKDVKCKSLTILGYGQQTSMCRVDIQTTWWIQLPSSLLLPNFSMGCICSNYAAIMIAAWYTSYRPMLQPCCINLDHIDHIDQCCNHAAST